MPAAQHIGCVRTASTSKSAPYMARRRIKVKYYGADAMSEGERREFMAWYNKEKVKVFDNRRMLEQYCQDDVTVLRQACRVFRREFLQIGDM